MSKRHLADPRTCASAKYWGRASALLAQRDLLMTEITLARQRAGTPRALLKKVTALLTRFWSTADWNGREDLLRAARWLLGVGRLQETAGRPKPRSKKKRPPGAGKQRLVVERATRSAVN